MPRGQRDYLGGPLGHELLPGQRLGVKVAGKSVSSELLDQSLHRLVVLLLDLGQRLSPEASWGKPKLWGHGLVLLNLLVRQVEDGIKMVLVARVLQQHLEAHQTGEPLSVRLAHLSGCVSLHLVAASIQEQRLCDCLLFSPSITGVLNTSLAIYRSICKVLLVDHMTIRFSLFVSLARLSCVLACQLSALT